MKTPRISILFALWISTCVLCVLVGRADARAQKDEIGYVSISPDGKLLAVTLKKDDTSFIYIVATDSGTAKRLTTNQDGAEFTPSFSPDGKEIAYVHIPARAKTSEIAIINTDGSNVRHWPAADGSPSTPIFTPDGKKIVFRSSGWYGHYSPIAAPHPHGWDYYIANSDGSGVQQLTRGAYYYASPASVSPDGKLMLTAIEDLKSGRQVVAYSLLTGELALSFKPKVPHADDDDNPTVNYPVFMPDGKKFLFMAASQGKINYDYDVYVGELGSTSVEKLTSRNGYAAGLTVSADGKKAAYLKTQFDLLGKPKETNIYLMDVTSRTATPLEVSLSP